MNRPVPRDIQCEPPYPGEQTVMFSLSDPTGLTAHQPTLRCLKERPHPITECGEWYDVSEVIIV